MVDALFVAAQREDSEYFEDKDTTKTTTTVNQNPTRAQSQVRVCEFCGSSNTPTWRRGPGGKGSLCNACGIKWRLRKRTKKGDHVADKVKAAKSPAAKRKRIAKDTDNDHMITLRHPITFKESTYEQEEDNMDSRKNYYCKFCNKTWDCTHFKNSQQFGAHCSNCSRRPQGDGMVPFDDLSSSSSSSPYSPSKSSYVPSPSSASSPSPSPSPSYYEAIKMPKRFPPPFEDPGYNLILILRLMQEVDDLSEYEEESPAPSLSLPHPLSSHSPSLSLSSHSHAHSHHHSHAPIIPTPTPVL